MKEQVKYKATIKGDRIVSERTKADVTREARATWPEGTPLQVTIQEWHEDKTNPQLRYYHGAIVPTLLIVFLELGYRVTPNQASEAYQQYVSTTNKEMLETPRGPKELRVRLSEMSKDQMRAFIDEAIEWCAEKGWVVETPEEHYA